MMVWALEVAAEGKPRNIVHLAHIPTDHDGGKCLFGGVGVCEAQTVCGQTLTPPEWRDAEWTVANGVKAVVCRECAEVTVAKAWDEL